MKNAGPKVRNNESVKMLIITLKTFYGLEEVLSEELDELGFTVHKKLNRAVQILGSWRDVYYLNLHTRCAISILIEIKQFKLNKQNDLYQECRKINWPSLFTVDKTFAVKGAIFSDLYKHSQYPFLLVKDAIVDSFREHTNERPNVNVKSPQIVVDLYVNGTIATISLNTSGLPLFQRGYRQSSGEAPLNEVVAAGLIRMSGWDRKSTFIDPFCGSGTLLIEAALLATEIPSNIERTHYSFKNFANFNEILWNDIFGAATKQVKSLPCHIIGSDISDEMIIKTRRNLRQLSIGRLIETNVLPFEEAKHIDKNGIMITNPPYGERMGSEIDSLYQALGNWMKHEMKGFQCWVLSSNKNALKSVGLKPDKKITLFNGNLECSFRRYPIDL